MKLSYLDCLCFLIVFIHLIECCRYLWQLKNALYWLKSAESEKSVKTVPNCIHLLIPVYNEAGVIEASVKYFRQFTFYPEVHLYYVSTQKEGANGGTIEALQALTKHYDFIWLHYPGSDGKKADQLNWAIRWILDNKLIGNKQSNYFGIYDVDSRPDPHIIQALLYARDQIYQQPPIYLENYRRLGTFQRAGALLQTKWELSRNVAVWRKNYQRHLQGHSMVSLPSCIGHGLFIRSDLIQSEAFFNTETLTEDLELGYRLAFQSIPITLLPAVDICGYAPRALDTIPQTSRWFSGEVNLYHYYRQMKQSSYFTWLVLKRYYLTFKWALGAPLLTMSLAELIIYYPATILLLLLSMLLYVYFPIKWLCRFPSWTKYVGENRSMVSLVVAGVIWPLYNSLGPLSYLLAAPLRTLQRKPLTFVRTPKN